MKKITHYENAEDPNYTRCGRHWLSAIFVSRGATCIRCAATKRKRKRARA